MLFVSYIRAGRARGASWFALVFLTILSCQVHAESRKEVFERLKSEKDQSRINAFVNEWLANEPDNPDAYIVPANYYFATRGILTSSDSEKPLGHGRYNVESPNVEPPKGEFIITDPKTGKRVGSIGPSNIRDEKDVQKAIDLLRQATTRFPRRMDIWCGLAFMMQETGRFEEQIDVLKDMVSTATKTPSELSWLNGGPIKDSAGVFIPDKLHGYATYYCRKETPKDDERFLEIAQLSAEHYPHHPYAFNDIALYYSIQKNLPETRRYLELALQADPNDTLVLMNLADTCLKMKDKAKARESYQKIIKLDSNPEHTREAKKALAQLDSKTGA